MTMMAECNNFQTQFSNPWRRSDAVLVVEDQQFHVHRQYLSLHSPVFEAMFNSDFKEKDMKQIDLPGKDPIRFQEFLCMLYNTRVEITKENCEDLLSLAREYQVDDESVRGQCELFLKRQASSDCFWSLRVAAEFGLKDVVEECAEIGKNMKFIDKENINRDYELTKPDGKAPVLEKRLIELEDIMSSVVISEEKCAALDHLKKEYNKMSQAAPSMESLNLRRIYLLRQKNKNRQSMTTCGYCFMTLK